MAASHLHAGQELQNCSGQRPKLFVDEAGNPSDRCGPDLNKARPIDDVISGLRRLRSGYAVKFWQACKESGIDISVTRMPDGEDRLGLGFPLDCQEDLRRPRYNALVSQLKRSERRRQGVLELTNLLGNFADNQPFSSI